MKRDKTKIVNLNALKDVAEGEIVENKEPTAQPVDTAVKTSLEQAAQAVQANNQRQEDLQRLLGEILKKHGEQASLAMEFLKSAINQKIETLLHGTANFEQLVSQAYALADAFKAEVDRRYTNDVTETTNKFFGGTAANVETKTEEKPVKKLN
jgi:hypothetical protein